MTKKHFIALADAIRAHNDPDNICVRDYGAHPFTQDQIGVLADFCWEQNRRFDRGRWLDYIAGKCGPGGGKVR